MSRLRIYQYRCNLCGKMMKTDESSMNHAMWYHAGEWDFEYNEDGFSHEGTVKNNV